MYVGQWFVGNPDPHGPVLLVLRGAGDREGKQLHLFLLLASHEASLGPAHTPSTENPK